MDARVAVGTAFLALLAACGETGSDTDRVAASPAASQAAPASPSTPERQPSTSGRASPSPPGGSPRTGVPPARDGTEIVVEDSDFGPMLFDRTGQAIYLFDVETTSEPRCYDACAEAWPPVYADGSPVAGRGVDRDLLGTVRRREGRLQVTYAGHPLYFYAHEGKREVLCHDVVLNGGTWYVVQPDGSAAPPG
jgi:predicted lipoprotein with Yx(FWY)xxD motif